MTKREFEECLKTFEGPSLQTPPVYSALRINGKRCHELARSGAAVNMEDKKRTVETFSLQLLNWNPPYFDIGTSFYCLADEPKKFLVLADFTFAPWYEILARSFTLWLLPRESSAPSKALFQFKIAFLWFVSYFGSHWIFLARMYSARNPESPEDEL